MMVDNKDLETINQSVERLDAIEHELMEANDYADFIIQLLKEKSDVEFSASRCREELGDTGVVKRLQIVTKMLRHELNYLPSKLKTIEGLIK